MHTNIPSIEELKGKWQQYVGAAKVAWGDISEDELLKLEGHTQKLAGLIHERYAVSREEADMQVERFFTKHRF
ncbi:MAG: CsbD family protein [Steroidobacteraceae bacterium]